MFTITPIGIENSIRTNSNDGYVYAGCKKYLKSKKDDIHQTVINDLIIPSKEATDKHRGRHF